MTQNFENKQACHYIFLLMGTEIITFIFKISELNFTTARKRPQQKML